ncbi:MAG: hypothetical protein SNJ82_08070 [Gemmataceae bacterium]
MISLFGLLALASDPSFGVEESRIQGRTRYHLAGREVPRAEALKAIAGPHWPDVNRWRVSVIGEGRAAVLQDFASHAALAAWRDRCLVRGYEPSHWHLAPGFVTAGKPTIYVQAADGVVLHRQDDYSGGAEALAAALAAIDEATQLRKPRPDYKPEADPDRRRRLLPWSLGRLPWSLYVGAAAVVVVLLLVWRKV